MKTLKTSTLLMIAMGLLLFACRPDNVAPTENGGGDPKLAGSAGDPHPALDTICQNLDTMFFIREDNGSRFVDKCYSPAGPITCPNTTMPWGYLEMAEGYYMDTNFIDCDFTFAAGWYIDKDNWKFGVDGSFQFDNNGIPLITSDWGQQDPNEFLNRWQLRLKVYDLPTPCFQIACQLVGVKLNLFGAVVTNSNTTLWAANRNWNNPTHPQHSSSRWLMNVCPIHCMDNQVIPDTTRLCKAVYTGLTCTGNTQNCTALEPYSSEPGVITYTWSNGAPTSSQTVCPTTNTSYTVTISSDGHPIHIVIYNVKVINVACTIGSNVGGHGSGNHGCQHGSGGIGSGHSGHGAGGSGSSHHPKCDHNHGNGSGCNSNHSYGCDGNHNGGACNHKGHGYHCNGDHAANKSCNGGHARGCNGKHATTVTCVANGGHNYRCNGQHVGGNCNTLVSHAQNCTLGNHGNGRGCNDGHDHKPGGHGNGSGFGSGNSGHNGSSHGGHGSAGHGSGHHGSGGHGSGNHGLGVQICHTPPGHPEQAITMCVAYNKLAQHVTNVCTTNGGGGNGGGGSNHNGGGHGSNHNGGGHGSNHNGGGHGSSNAHPANACTGRHGSTHKGFHGTTHVTHRSGWGANGSGKTGSSHAGCSGNVGSGHGGAHGSGHHGTPVHPGDVIGACNSNPCLGDNGGGNSGGGGNTGGGNGSGGHHGSHYGSGNGSGGHGSHGH